MPRITGVDIPPDKPIWISLTYIRGIGRTNSRQILKEAGIEGGRRAKELSEEELAKIIGIIDRSGILVEGALQRSTQMNIQRLRDIACYRGLRHRRGLPVRGQRTRSKAPSAKGRRHTWAWANGGKE